jgi:hypothetical protein
MVAYDCDCTVRLQEAVQVLEKLRCEQVYRFCSASEDVVYDVIKPLVCILGCSSCICNSIFNHWGVVIRERKIL